MSDLIIGLAIVSMLSAGLFLLALRVGRGSTPATRKLLALATVVAILLYAWKLWDSPLLAGVLPYSNLIIVGNWFPVGAAFLAGLVFHEIPFSRRAPMMLALSATTGFCLLEPLVGKTPECRNEWNASGLCVQTTDATCSAACGASLLGLHGIQATEQEMADLCLTRRGTRWQGLYRALKKKTRGTVWDVEVVRCSADELRRLNGSWILSVGIDNDSVLAEELQMESGWRADVNHSVLKLATNRRNYTRVFDPSPEYGIEYWSPETMRELYRGNAVRLVRRSTVPDNTLASTFSLMTSSLGFE